jgi:hypothetical protein
MDYQELVRLFSAPRLERYLEAVVGDEVKAVQLYQQAQILASYYFALIGHFEIMLRNKIDQHFSKQHQNQTTQWLLWLGHRGSPLDINITRNTHHHLNETIRKIKREMRNKGQSDTLTNHKIISGMTLGFWNTLFYKDEFITLGESIIEIAPNIPLPAGRDSAFYLKKYRRTQFSNRLNLITAYRNKIAHHDQIVLAGDNTLYLRPLGLLERYINELTGYVGETTDVYAPVFEHIRQQQTRLGNIVR